MEPLDLLLPVAVALWAWGVDHTNTGRLGGLGLLSVLPVPFYAGLLIVVVSAVCWLAKASPSPARLTIHTIVLAVMLYGTAPLVYDEPRYAWLYKHVGVVQYIAVHGQLATKIDIYQNWPGFFALAGWFDRVAGLPIHWPWRRGPSSSSIS